MIMLWGILARNLIIKKLTLKSKQVDKAESKSSSWCRSEEHTSGLQSRQYLVCRLLLEKEKLTSPCRRDASSVDDLGAVPTRVEPRHARESERAAHEKPSAVPENRKVHVRNPDPPISV